MDLYIGFVKGEVTARSWKMRKHFTPFTNLTYKSTISRTQEGEGYVRDIKSIRVV